MKEFAYPTLFMRPENEISTEESYMSMNVKVEIEEKSESVLMKNDPRQ